MSLFITFEGGEGCGKSYQAGSLFRWLNRLDLPALLTREPGGTPPGERITRLLKWGKQSLQPATELLLFNASRAELVNRVIRPALAEGKIVICDRYADSTVAYQGYGRGLDLDTIAEVNRVATGGLVPNLTVLLDIPVETGLARKEKYKPDRFHQEDLDFHNRVRQGYLKLAREEPARWLVIDAARSRGQIAGVIRQRVSVMLSGSRT